MEYELHGVLARCLFAAARLQRGVRGAATRAKGFAGVGVDDYRWSRVVERSSSTGDSAQFWLAGKERAGRVCPAVGLRIAAKAFLCVTKLSAALLDKFRSRCGPGLCGRNSVIRLTGFEHSCSMMLRSDRPVCLTCARRSARTKVFGWCLPCCTRRSRFVQRAARGTGRVQRPMLQLTLRMAEKDHAQKVVVVRFQQAQVASVLISVRSEARSRRPRAV